MNEATTTKFHPVDVHVGRQVRFARLKAGQSQTQLGRALGITFQQVQKYEKGSNRISASRLFEIAKALHVDVRDFFNGTEAGEEGSLRQPNDGVIQPVDIALARRLSGIVDIELKRKFLALVDALRQ